MIQRLDVPFSVGGTFFLRTTTLTLSFVAARVRCAVVPIFVQRFNDDSTKVSQASSLNFSIKE